MPLLILKLLGSLIARVGALFTLGKEPGRLVKRSNSSSASASAVDNKSLLRRHWYWMLSRKFCFASESGVGLNRISMSAFKML